MYDAASLGEALISVAPANEERSLITRDAQTKFLVLKIDYFFTQTKLCVFNIVFFFFLKEIHSNSNKNHDLIIDSVFNRKTVFKESFFNSFFVVVLIDFFF